MHGLLPARCTVGGPALVAMGSFGAVYHARLDGAPCVAKRAAAGERAAQFFETEAHFEASGQLHLVWERCGEATLGEYLERGDEGRVELTAALGCVASELPRRTLQLVLEALAHIHSLGVVHRDVKPHNLLVDTRGRTLALIDFGSACDVAGWVVQRGLEAGRVLYCPPEQLLAVRQPFTLALPALTEEGLHDLAAWRIDAAAADALPDAWESAFPLDGEAWQLLCGLITPVPADRPVAAEALLSPFLNADCHSTGEPTPAPLPWTLDAVVAGTTAAPRRIVAEECGLD
ncbi:hypothetical protein EMIHUDRAFT_216005 [Emiliania huxleyi CCMP1516]|uniref:Protein kinase domain-containing protein n=2 Tax=Emiliania huxleyi TaxID=2903 RepID=A0A0D3IGA0_EMIH1|nr:hypothetical protein EMIHUDRAFT_216005 [Emiliania huxleyi CCMP1516]EOD10285.1 hypothetical protein EMIHUDRAFT_216005 [Emiliania huxleyi CCMP1516]|eukprot:XP_005762714.1 hypothetical protein EMIHUDRAFT_216005 [Emiliania huxleyi CCMP1516]